MSTDPNAIHCRLCGQTVVGMELERHIVDHRVLPGKTASAQLEWAVGTYREAPDEENLRNIVRAVQAEERLRFQELVRTAEDVAVAAGRVQRLSSNTGPTFWYDT